jgi:hypothetical protein
MEKLVYLVWAGPGVASADVGRRLRDDVGARLLACGAGSLSLCLADLEADVGGSVPIRSPESAPAAVVSLWLDSVDRRAEVEDALAPVAPRLAGYLVTESVPRDFDRRGWPDGARTPGVVLMTVFEKPARLTTEEFLARWHGSHTPLSLLIHPLWRYVRNVVARPLTKDAPALMGIVAEHFRSAEDLTDPMRFYGGQGSKETMRANMQRVLEDVSTFLDLERTQSWVMSEYILKT